MNTDITALLYRIKDNIKAIEAGDTRDLLLDEVRSDFLDLLELIKLFLISERDSYYGYFLMNMQFRANFYVNCIAGIKLNEFPPVLEANPLLLCKFTLKEIIYVICHEIDHVVLNHPAEMVKANPDEDPQKFYEFNLAADASVNDRINHEIVAEKHNYLKQPGGVITSGVLAKKFKIRDIRSMENYAYYFDLILKNAEKEGQDSSQQNGQDSMMSEQKAKEGISSSKGGKGRATDDPLKKDDSKKEDADSDEDETPGGQQKKDDSPGQADGSNEGEGNGDNSAEDNGAGNSDSGDSSIGAGDEPERGLTSEGNGEDKIVTAANCGKLKDHDWEAGADAEDAAASVKEFVNASFGMMNEESRGMMPGFFMSQVEKINKPPVLSWQAILKKYVGTITANKRKTRMRLNRRQPERFDLSGSVDDKVLKIVVAIDTSGSVSDNMIAEIFNEIFEILAKRKHDITVIECDSKVQRVYKAKNPSEIKMKVRGRGGTMFTPVINHINKDKYYRDALLIYFTDGYGEYEIPRPRTYRNIWVVFGDARNLSVKEPYGAVLTL